MTKTTRKLKLRKINKSIRLLVDIQCVQVNKTGNFNFDRLPASQ